MFPSCPWPQLSLPLIQPWCCLWTPTVYIRQQFPCATHLTLNDCELSLQAEGQCWHCQIVAVCQVFLQGRNQRYFLEIDSLGWDYWISEHGAL